MDNQALSREELASDIESVDWYHTIDLGNGLITPGFYDHRPYLDYYGIPEGLQGKTVLDVGAASGFFSFEFERRGAQVTATDLPKWFDHDFGPEYQPDRGLGNGNTYLHRPFAIAKEALGSQVREKYINVYDISAETLGTYDLVFCGSLLIHLTDPIKALWNIRDVTREKAIVATVLAEQEKERPFAWMIGHERGDAWWVPTRACLELMAVSAGFVGIEWISDFRLDYRDGTPGPYHGVLHAYPTTEHWTSHTLHRDEVIARYRDNRNRSDLEDIRAEVKRLEALVAGYERGLFIRFTRWLNRFLGR